jgi:hypothetical protein
VKSWGRSGACRTIAAWPLNERYGVGAIRSVRTGPLRVREEIIEVVPDRRIRYRLLDGLPMRNYIGETTLEALPDGTRIRWQSSFFPVVPGTGWIFRLVMGAAQRVLIRSLASAPEGICELAAPATSRAESRWS